MRAAVGLSLVLAGCAEPASREYAVTVLDAAELECRGTSRSAALEPETMEALADDIADAWEELRLEDPPAPQGRILRLNETEVRVQLWFDPHPGEIDEVASSVGLQVGGFDDPLAVYAGETHEDYVEASYADIINTDVVDEEGGRELCGDRPRVNGVLAATDLTGLQGRIRWYQHVYVDDVTSACAGHIECVRDVQVDGLQVE